MKGVRSLLAACLLLPACTLADCSNAGIWVWPGAQAIGARQVFTIEGYADSQEVIRKLSGDYHAYLGDGSSMIELEVLGLFEGDMRLTEALARPKTPLSFGVTYELVITGIDDYEEHPQRWNPTTQESEPTRWKVSATESPIATILSQRPREERKTLMHYGCGPAMWVFFQVTRSSAPDALVKVTVREQGSDHATTYVLPMEKGVVKLGHGMCSGAFTHKADATYTVTFDLIEVNGKPRGAPTASITFTPPTEATSGE